MNNLNFNDRMKQMGELSWNAGNLQEISPEEITQTIKRRRQRRRKSGMNSVNINRVELLAIVKENRERHAAAFEEAQKGFTAKLKEELQALIGRIDHGHSPRARDLRIDLSAPEDHTAEYDQVLDMLRYETRESVELSSYDFDQYVNDRWQWSGKFREDVSSYSSIQL
jgi:hypothetical protein